MIFPFPMSCDCRRAACHGAVQDSQRIRQQYLTGKVTQSRIFPDYRELKRFRESKTCQAIHVRPLLGLGAQVGRIADKALGSLLADLAGVHQRAHAPKEGRVAAVRSVVEFHPV